MRFRSHRSARNGIAVQNRFTVLAVVRYIAYTPFLKKIVKKPNDLGHPLLFWNWHNNKTPCSDAMQLRENSLWFYYCFIVFVMIVIFLVNNSC